MRQKLIPALFALVVISSLALDSEAIPAFARKYQFSCTVCHAPAPRLKPFGEEFAGRGFRLEDPSQEPTRASYDTGDPLLTLWREVPLAMRLEGFGAYKEDAAAEADFEFPWVFKVLSGGPLSERFSYYFYVIFEKNEFEGLEDAYLQYNGLFGSQVDVIFGQFQVSDPLFKRELRLERNDYLIYKALVGESDVKLTYERGLMFLASPGGTDLAFEVVNGNGIPSGEFDKDDYKNLALRASRDLGKGVRFGLFGYWGKEKGGIADLTNEVTYFGPDMTIDFGDRWQVNAQYLLRSDDDPFFVGASDDVETDGGFAEVVYLPRGADGRYAWALLYNTVDSDDELANQENLTITMNYLFARNIRLLLEAGRDFEHDATEASVGLIVAF
ncbi:MAG: hypothetical protein ACSLFQ_17185 [Thermoanaerobaculia bacterium]